MPKLDASQFTAYFLIILAITSYIFGFIFDEDPGGGGKFKGDVNTIYSNLKIFLANDIYTASMHEGYMSSRIPGVYIFHKLFNPFVDTLSSYRKSVFAISFFLPILFFFCIRKKFKDTETTTLMIISSIIYLSPYFRTSAYWGLEENLSLIFMMLSYLSFNYVLSIKNQNTKKFIFSLFLLPLFSSLTLYFDSKLVIIPLICFAQIILSNINFKYKSYLTILYIIFSLPFFYFLFIWGNIVPPNAQDTRFTLMPENIGYSMAMIAFYLFPLFFFKNNILADMTSFIKDRYNIFWIIVFIFFLFYLMSNFDFENQEILGKGILHKTSLILFEKVYYQKLFTYIGFFFSFIIVLFHFNKGTANITTFIFFTLFSLICYPVLQEYFDPIILLIAFTFLNISIKLTKMRSYFVFLYFFLFLLGSNIYYYKVFNNSHPFKFNKDSIYNFKTN